MMAPRTPRSASMAGETSPVYAPSSSQNTSWAAIVMPVPAAALHGFGRVPVKGGATTTSRSSRPRRAARPGRCTKAAPSALVLYIFQLPAISGTRAVARRSTASRPLVLVGQGGHPGSSAPSMNSSDAPPPMET